MNRVRNYEKFNPRSAVGFNQDSTKVYFVVVDGRQSNLSVGMTLDELANLMLSIGAHNAVNLDGGGSSTLVIHNEVVNSPSDAGGERSVANALFAVREMEVSSIPSVPNLLIPQNGATNQKDTVILKWQRSVQAAVYDLQVSTTQDFSSALIVNKTIIMDTTFRLSGLTGLKTYYWRLRARNILGNTSFSSVYNFTTGFPTIPTLLQPPHATTNVSTSPLLIWAKESAATYYRIQLAHGSTIVPSNTILDTIVNNDTTLQLLNLQNNKLYYWRVSAGNQYGSSNWSTVFGFKTEPTTEINDNKNIPEKFYLEQNYPNPFGTAINSDTPVTTIKFSIPSIPLSSENGLRVRLVVYDILGNEVSTLVNEPKLPGYYEIQFNTSNLSGGVYFYRLEYAGFSHTKKFILIK